MWDNKLYNDTMSVGGRAANLADIKVPILHAVRRARPHRAL